MAKNTPFTSTKDFGTRPTGDMSRAASTANGKGKPESNGSTKPQTEPGRAATGEMSKVKKIADCPR